MQDKTAIGNIENANTPSKAFREYIESLVEEVVLNNAVFNDHKKYLQRYSHEEGLDYAMLEKSLTEFFETVEELKHHESKACERLATNLGKDCYLLEETVDKLMASMNEARMVRNEATEKAYSEAEETVIDEWKLNSQSKAEPTPKPQPELELTTKPRGKIIWMWLMLGVVALVGGILVGVKDGRNGSVYNEKSCIDSTEIFKQEFWELIHQGDTIFEHYSRLHDEYKGQNVICEECDYLKHTILKDWVSFKEWRTELRNISYKHELDSIYDVDSLIKRLKRI